MLKVIGVFGRRIGNEYLYYSIWFISWDRGSFGEESVRGIIRLFRLFVFWWGCRLVRIKVWLIGFNLGVFMEYLLRGGF